MRLHILASSFLVVGLVSAQYPSGGVTSGDIGLPVNEFGCPLGTHDCVPFIQCTPDGDINTSGAGLIDPRVRPLTECHHPDYPDVPNLCCRIPGAVDPVPSCPGFQVCVGDTQCRPDGTVNTDGAGLINPRFGLRCYTDKGVLGVCCRPPTPHLDTCPAGSSCIYKSDCAGQIVDAQNNFQPYDTNAFWSQCTIPGTNDNGVCCLPPTPYIEKCPVGSVCTSHSTCTGQIYNAESVFQPYQTQTIWTECPIAGGSGIGVCCINPPPLIEICHGGSSCLPKEFCTGDIIDAQNVFQPYETQTTWSQCQIGGGGINNGVCCRNPPPPLQVANQCGYRNLESDLGTRSQVKLLKDQAAFGEFPWQGIIFYTNFTFVCGASLVTQNHLVTAAHCIRDHYYTDFRVRLGEWQVDAYDEPLPYVDVEIKGITVHPGFNPENLHNDVAVIELAHPVTLQYHINTICLPTPNDYLQADQRCFATGWGKDAFTGQYQARLKKVDVPFVTHSYCQDLLRQTRLGRYFKLDPSFLCAGGEPNVDACTGDGGGPLVCQNSQGSYVLHGIVAWGIDCGQPNVPGVYADTRYFADWISEAIYGVPVNQVSQPNNPYGKK